MPPELLELRVTVIASTAVVIAANTTARTGNIFVLAAPEWMDPVVGLLGQLGGVVVVSRMMMSSNAHHRHAPSAFLDGGGGGASALGVRG